MAILDGSAGVEAQTITVWRQANRHGIPRIAFINKMDKPNAKYVYSVDNVHWVIFEALITFHGLLKLSISWILFSRIEVQMTTTLQ